MPEQLSLGLFREIEGGYTGPDKDSVTVRTLKAVLDLLPEDMNIRMRVLIRDDKGGKPYILDVPLSWVGQRRGFAMGADADDEVPPSFFLQDLMPSEQSRGSRREQRKDS